MTQQSFNKNTYHPLQSYEWGEFRKKTGIKVIREQDVTTAFQVTIHPIPHSPWTIGYVPKGVMPDKKLLEKLRQIGEKEKCIFIQIEPNVIKAINGAIVDKRKIEMHNNGLRQAAHPLFTKYTFLLDLTKSEDELLQSMHPKARYNIKVAKKHNVIVKQDNSQEAFEQYWRLTEETTKRQQFYAHTKQYHQYQFETFAHTPQPNTLSSHLFTASYDGKILTTLLFFVYKDTLYYPYGASSNNHRNVMHSNLAMWEGIRFGKSLGLKKFDMWGAMSMTPDTKDPWFGFHSFKEKFGPDHIEFFGSYDLVLNPTLYAAYTIADKIRWIYLKLIKSKL